MEELVPHKPEFDELQLIGKNPLKPKTSDESKNSQEFIINNTWINQKLFDKESTNQNANEMNPYYINVDNYDDVLASHVDVIAQPVFGPSIIFGGQPARWTGNDNENFGIVALESRLNFETKAGKRVLATFEIVNTGTAAIYYDWKVFNFFLIKKKIYQIDFFLFRK